MKVSALLNIRTGQLKGVVRPEIKGSDPSRSVKYKNLNPDFIQVTAYEEDGVITVAGGREIQIREAKWNIVKALREDTITTEINHNDHPIQVQPQDRESLRDAFDEMTDEEELPWSAGDDSLVLLKKEDIKNILSIFRRRKQKAFQASWIVETALNESSNPELIEERVKYRDALNSLELI